MPKLETLSDLIESRWPGTQKQLAERSGVCIRAVADMMAGRTRMPHRSTLAALASALRCSADRVSRAAWNSCLAATD